MAWAVGELERMQLFYEQRANRFRNRARLELALLPSSSEPYLAAQASFSALVWDAQQKLIPPETADEFPESDVVINQNLY